MIGDLFFNMTLKKTGYQMMNFVPMIGDLFFNFGAMGKNASLLMDFVPMIGDLFFNLQSR